MDDGRWTLRKVAMASAVVAAVGFAALGVARLGDLWMLSFGSVVVAVVIRSIADPLSRRLRLNNGLSVALAVLIIVAALAAVGFLFGRQISIQLHQLLERLPGAWAQFQARVAASPALGQLMQQLPGLGSGAQQALAIAPRMAMGLASGVATLLLVLVAGMFLAAHPLQAREGALAMFPMRTRPRLREVMDACGRALKGWLRAQLVSMVVVGALVGVGMAAIGAPAPVALGMVAGLAQFVPIVGPIVAAGPGLLVAASGGAKMLLLTLALYLGVSQLEANLITPLVQKNVAALPIVLGIFGVVALGTLFGPLGVLFATPLTLTIYVAVTMLYRQDVLHDPEARAPGDEPAP